MGYDELLGLLIDCEIANRTTKRFQSRLRAAKVRHGGASIKDVDFRSPRRLDRALFQELATGLWIKEKRNLLINGPCSAGKTWLACAFGQKAGRDNDAVIYKRLPRLFSELQLAQDDGHFPRIFRQFELLILDDWGAERMTAPRRRDLIEIVETATEVAQTWSPASFRSRLGTTSWVNPHSRTPSWIAQSTTHTA